MKQELMKSTKIGEFLAIGAELDGDEIGLFLASSDISASCGFKFDEWELFVVAVNKIDRRFKEITEK